MKRMGQGSQPRRKRSRRARLRGARLGKLQRTVFAGTDGRRGVRAEWEEGSHRGRVRSVLGFSLLRMRPLCGETVQTSRVG